MGKFIKSGKIVVMLAGRQAGKKAIVVKEYAKGNVDRNFGHCLVAGIDRYPRKITKGMSKTKKEKRSKIKPFIKHVNFNHIMPTRYQIQDLDLKRVVDADAEDLTEQLKKVKALFEARYKDQTQGKSQKNKDGAKYFFKKLRF